ncbi:hypothetical protein GCM10022200_21120 [Microbacterium awajiense]|uniref:2-oxoglutarate dehydrogenase n=1 Tax=Microbacterium awajiense TaxID=415214 RepID=A0ABP7AQJ9_9MICO
MTVTPLGPGRTAHHPPRARAAFAVFAALLAVLAFAIAPPKASAAPLGITLTLAPVGNGIVEPGDALTVSVALANASSSPTVPAPATLSIGAAPFADRSALTAWLAGQTSGVTVAAAGTAVLPSVDAASSGATPIAVPGDDPRLTGLVPGVYPLLIEATLGDEPLTATSVMTVPDPDGPASGVGVIVPITAGAIDVGLLGADAVAGLTAPAGALTAALDAADGTGAILAVDPAIPAAIRVLGDEAPADATAWLARLMTMTNSRFALQFGDADPVAQLAAGQTRPVGPTSLTAYLDSTASAGEPTPDSTESADAETSPPSLTQLLDIGPARASVYWPGAGTVDADTVAALGGLGDDEAASLTVLSSAEVDRSAASARADADDASLLVYDADVSRMLEQASLREGTALRASSLTAATAFLAFARAESAGRPIVVTVGRADDRSRIALRTAIATAMDAPGLSPRDLDTLIATDAVTARVTASAGDDARAAAASDLFAQEVELSRFATILDDPALLTGPERAEILQLLGLAWRPQPGEWRRAVVDHEEATATTLDSVGLLPTSTVNLVGSGAGLRFSVRNDLPYPVTLVLYAMPDDLRLDVQRATNVTATAASNTRVEVPVQARVGNGEVTLALQLRSPTSVAIGDTEFVDVNVRAEWEGVGIAALAIVVGGLLVIGLFRTFRRRRGRPDPAVVHDEAETDR